MRYVIYGAGAIGGTIGGKLAQHGHDVTLICRGAHLEAVKRDGLLLRTPDGDTRLPIPAVGGPAEIDWQGDEAVIVTMKSQDTEAALEALRDAAGDVPVVCSQNGVANERMALRVFSCVYGLNVRMPATHLDPGVVIAHSAPVTGVLDLGCYPEGADHLADKNRHGPRRQRLCLACRAEDHASEVRQAADEPGEHRAGALRHGGGRRSGPPGTRRGAAWRTRRPTSKWRTRPSSRLTPRSSQ